MNEIVNNKVNLCDSCSHFYPGCPAAEDEVVFGDGIGHDNICACSKYQPETHEKRTETHACDLIDRDAAIDFIDAGHLCNPNEPRWSDNEVVNFLKSRPSAQPEKTQLSGESTTKDSTFDCISRRSAIDALGEKPLVWDDLSDFDLGKAAQWSDDVDAIKELPSAQSQLEECPIYGGMCGYPSNLCYECPRHEGAKERPQWWTEGLQPFAQPERMKGRWKLLPGRDDEHIRYLHCSVCHFNGDYESNFCPNCGADMRGWEE